MKILSAATLLALTFFLIYPAADLDFSRLFYVEGTGFIYREHIISQIIYYSVRILTITLCGLGLFIVFYDASRKFFPAFLKKILDRIRATLKLTSKQAGFLLWVIIITPGIIVHWVMKPIWERARPVNITEFGGQFQFSSFYHLFAGQDGNSFPSGHASMATSLVALAFIVPIEKRRTVLIYTSLYAIIASTCRIWQGGHFLSDVVFSAILTLWTILLVKRFYLDRTF